MSQHDQLIIYYKIYTVSMQKFTQQRALSNSLIVARQQEMGKASKWMMNFLLGRKEEKEKKKDVEENEKFSSGILPSAPTAKRRWSFGRSSSQERVRTTSKSPIDLINTNSVETLATVSSEDQQRIVNNLALVVAAPAPVESSVRASKPARYGISRAVADAAATKIQAAFRSYLARRALCALRALVKLQALVRGHLVRKQTTATLRSMHALMSIQVRARFQRIQMAEASQVVLKTDSSRYRINPQETEFRRPHREAIDTNNYETLSKSQYGHLNKIGRTEHGVSTRFTGELSFAKREPYQYEEIAFSTAQNTPQHYQGISNTIPGRASFTYQQPDHAHTVSHDFSFLPNYMANTESSWAKARSRSEPRQRPELSLRTGSKRWDSNNGSQHSSPRLKHADQGLLSNNGSQHSSPRLKHADQGLHSGNGSQRSSPRMKQAVHGNQDPWFMKPYPSKRLLKDRESDANSTSTSHSNYYNSLIANVPPVNLY